MIAKEAYEALRTQHVALAQAGDKLSELLRDELAPDDEILGAETVSVSEVPGVVVVTSRKVLAVWTSTMLWVFSFPTYQEFHLAHIREAVPQEDGNSLRLFAAVDPEKPEEDYEESVFRFEDTEARGRFVALLDGRCSGLKPS